MRATLLLLVVFCAVLAVSAARGVTQATNGLVYFENFDDTTQGSDIFAIAPNGTGLRNVTRTEEIDETDPDVSPNGKLIAFVSNQGGETFHLRVMSSDGSGVRALPGGGEDHESPAWSPNGRQIAFSRCATLNDETGECTSAQIAVIGSDGKSTKVLTPRAAGAVDSRPAWSPSGRQLVFQRTNADGKVSLWTVQATGKAVRRILNDASDLDRNPSYTANGLHVVYAADVGGHEAVWQVNPNGHGKKKLFEEAPDTDDPTTGAGTENPMVAPNGKQLVFTAGGDLWLSAINGKDRVQLTKDGGDEADWARG
jgi:Tol biopolymer transport system component